MLPMTAMAAVGAAPMERLFISGHSLTDPPLPVYLSLIAASLGPKPLQWNMQSIPGSPIRARTHGANTDEAFKRGTNRTGRDLDVLAEWREPRTVSGGLYDGLLVAEQHGVLNAMTWHDSVHALALAHAKFLAANPSGSTWLYESWLDLSSKDDPSRWIAYERAASGVWQCVASRASRITALMGPDRPIRSVPSGAALAHLVERATRAEGIAGLSERTPRATIDRLFSDDVHLTPLGQYYMAAVVYATLWERSPVGAQAPEGLTPALARTLQQEAWNYVEAYRATRPSIEAAACRQQLREGFITQHWSYVRDTVFTRESGRVVAYARWLRQVVSWHLRIRRAGASNPFRDG